MMLRPRVSLPIKMLLGGMVFAIVFSVVYPVYAYINHDEVVIAARRGDIAEVRRLAWFDFDLSRVGYEEHWTPLGAAVLSGNVQLVRFLLDKQVDVDRKDDYGKTAVDLARGGGNIEMVQVLQAHGSK